MRKTDDKIVRHYAENIDKLLQFGYFEGMENHMKFFYPGAVTLESYLENPIIIFDELRDIKTRVEDVHKEYETLYGEMFERGEALSELSSLLYTFDDIKTAEQKGYVLTMTAFSADNVLGYARTLTFPGSEAMIYRGQFDMLSRDIKNWRREKFKVAILVGTQSRIEGVRENAGAVSDNCDTAKIRPRACRRRGGAPYRFMLRADLHIHRKSS